MVLVPHQNFRFLEGRADEYQLVSKQSLGRARNRQPRFCFNRCLASISNEALASVLNLKNATKLDPKSDAAPIALFGVAHTEKQPEIGRQVAGR